MPPGSGEMEFFSAISFGLQKRNANERVHGGGLSAFEEFLLSGKGRT
jgi:hypothetical protein